jgi:transposase
MLEPIMKKYIVDLSAQERDQLQRLLRSGKTSARKLTRAHILLKADEGLTDSEIVEHIGTCIPTIERTRKRFVEENLDCLNERPRPGQKLKLQGKAAARLIAEACSTAPEGRQRWTLRLLAHRVVELGLCESLSHESVRQHLKKTNLSPGNSNSGVFQK